MDSISLKSTFISIALVHNLEGKKKLLFLPPRCNWTSYEKISAYIDKNNESRNEISEIKSYAKMSV